MSLVCCWRDDGRHQRLLVVVVVPCCVPVVVQGETPYQPSRGHGFLILLRAAVVSIFWRAVKSQKQLENTVLSLHQAQICPVNLWLQHRTTAGLPHAAEGCSRHGKGRGAARDGRACQVCRCRALSNNPFREEDALSYATNSSVVTASLFSRNVPKFGNVLCGDPVSEIVGGCPALALC